MNRRGFSVRVFLPHGDPDGLKLVEKHQDDSPSMAACVCSARSANGLAEWMNNQGRTFKDRRQLLVPESSP